MVAVLIYAGLRREELLWLTLDDVDLKHGASGMLRIRAKTIAGESWQPKTKLNRAVPVSCALHPYLDRHTFSSQLAQAGVSLSKFATLMGNSPEICRRPYAALCPESMAAEVDFHSCPPHHLSHCSA